ncbi:MULTISPECIES: hypothetical protein [Aerococcus]|uniref:Phage resistance protein n=1 Tax=Aerococcus sanguinicola TaxID=119206 RepID=A0A5N1GMB8_9LACT|nr:MULTISPECIES: hypothetical protein [Aerococcus]KAA9301932.1 phage resistance protein [Aerococcus sanguinicola]MDK6368645.1 phage resistance protein [Aerococcus sp. UMB9870]MDK6679728.1 phage resistance protein [Aerococcus sp. UMB8608]MDK6686000.1 phage resistance protein [Aerococcus sp. UMB8623]MDK6940806.1 phage resistance protein [Aerococcus sp. UMB8487]
MDAKELHERLFQIKEKLDRVETTNLARIKDILNRIYFADIEGQAKSIENVGNVFHEVKGFEHGKYYKNLHLNYIIEAGKTGIFYGRIVTKRMKNGNDNEVAKPEAFSNYAMFVADVCSGRVIYSEKLECFLLLDHAHTYLKISEGQFEYHYGVEKGSKIRDFLQVFEELFSQHFEEDHGYNVLPYTIAGEDWIYNVADLKMEEHKLQSDELVESYFSEVAFSNLEVDRAKEYLEFINDKPECYHNMRLIYAYVVQRKMGIIQPEKIFLMKDSGGTGKGLFMHSMQPVFNVVPVDPDSLLQGTSIEKQNAFMRFLGAEVAHLNETGSITSKQWPTLRKIGTGEVLTGRYIGANQISFKSEAVLILDTNEKIEAPSLKANLRRMVNIAPKDRGEETPEETNANFKPWWDWIAPDRTPNVKAGLSFLLASLDYLKEQGGKFNFQPYTFPLVSKSEEFSETQTIMLRVIKQQGFILAGDEMLQKAIREDYGNLRKKVAREAVKGIGVEINRSKWIEGQNIKVHEVGNLKLFNEMYELLNKVA